MRRESKAIIKRTFADAFARARANGWAVRLHKPLTAGPYYSIRRKGAVHTSKGSNQELHHALWSLVQQFGISDEEADRRAERKRRIDLAASRLTVTFESPSYKDRKRFTA
jgi:hypothetical protein